MENITRNLIILGAIALTIAAAAVLFPRNHPSMNLSEQWTVMDVADGSTMTVRQTTGREIKIRLCGISPLGTESREKLRSLVAAAENEVIIIPVETNNGYTVAEVLAPISGPWGLEMSIQEEMLKSGSAYYKPSNCPNHDAFVRAEEIAIASKVGVWSREVGR